MTGAHRARHGAKRASGAATGLAVVSVLMILVAVGAAFVPGGHRLKKIPPGAGGRFGLDKDG